MYQISNEKFGLFIAELRKQKDLTQKELAEKLYVSDKTISKWERGLSMPNVVLLNYRSPPTRLYNLQLFQEKSTIASQRHDHASFPAFYQLNAWLLIAANITITFLFI